MAAPNSGGSLTTATVSSAASGSAVSTESSTGFSDTAASVYTADDSTPVVSGSTAPNGDTVTITATPSTTRPPIPLYTIYTPPNSCLEVITYDGKNFWQAGWKQKGDPNCFPPNFYDIVNSFYTPGICPESWTSAGTIPGMATTEQSMYDAMCCPMYVLPHISVICT